MYLPTKVGRTVALELTGRLWFGHHQPAPIVDGYDVGSTSELMKIEEKSVTHAQGGC